MKNISSPHLATLRQAKKPSRRVPIYTWSSRERVYVRSDAKSFVVLAIHNDATLEIPSRKTADVFSDENGSPWMTVTNRQTIYEIEINDAYTANSKNLSDGRFSFRRHSTKLFSTLQATRDLIIIRWPTASWQKLATLFRTARKTKLDDARWRLILRNRRWRWPKFTAVDSIRWPHMPLENNSLTRIFLCVKIPTLLVPDFDNSAWNIQFRAMLRSSDRDQMTDTNFSTPLYSSCSPVKLVFFFFFFLMSPISRVPRFSRSDEKSRDDFDEFFYLVTVDAFSHNRNHEWIIWNEPNL